MVKPSSQKELAGQLAGPIHITGLPSTPNSIASSARGRKATSIVAVFIACSDIPNEFCAGGVMHIILDDGTEVQPQVDKDKDQGRHPLALISEDKRAVGWLVNYANCCTSYPLSLKLVVYRPGKALREFRGDGRAIFHWRFVARGKQVAFYQSYPHGDLRGHRELREIETGRLIDKWNDDDPPGKMPAWAKGIDTIAGF